MKRDEKNHQFIFTCHNAAGGRFEGNNNTCATVQCSFTASGRLKHLTNQLERFITFIEIHCTLLSSLKWIYPISVYQLSLQFI